MNEHASTSPDCRVLTTAGRIGDLSSSFSARWAKAGSAGTVTGATDWTERKVMEARRKGNGTHKAARASAGVIHALHAVRGESTQHGPGPEPSYLESARDERVGIVPDLALPPIGGKP